MSGIAAALVVIVAVATAGCGGRPQAPRADAASPPATVPRPGREKLVAGALAMLARLDDFDEARASEQVFDRLNQWSHAAPPGLAAWSIDPLVAALAEPLRAEAEAALTQPSFAADGDVAFVRDRRWLADIAARVRGDAEGLDAATRLFAWTVRSLAIVGDPPMVSSAANPGTRWLSLGEILLAGRASAAQRAWVFLELARQAGLDAAMLATGGAGDTQRPWLPAVVVEGEAYLFEPTFGMPVPGPEGRGVATARQAAAEPAVLAALSLPDRPYPVGSADIAGLSVLVAADPPSLSRRMVALDKDVAATHGLRLAIDATAVGRNVAAALPGGGGRIGLWEFPWETATRRRTATATVRDAVARELAPLGIVMMQSVDGRAGGRSMRPLYAARVREFRGDDEGPDGAKAAYLAARPSRAALAAAVAGLPPEQAAAAERLYERMKEDATYWLGVLTLAEGEHEAAVDYLDRMLLQATPDSRWADAARTNLAQAFLGLGRIDDAIRTLREDGSPQRFGSRLLADRLERDRQPR